MQRALQPVSEHFSKPQIRRILGISAYLLTSWERQGLIRPALPLQPATASSLYPEPPARQSRSSGPPDRLYTFSDIITLKTLLELRRNRVPLAHIRSSLASLKEKLTEIENPLSELQINSLGRRLAVHFQGVRMEPLTGQLLFNFEPDKKKGKLHPLGRAGQAKKLTEAEKRALAEKFFLAGLRYEEQLETIPKAIRAYQKAIEFNPQAMGALINMGTIHYNCGELGKAERCYRTALSIDPGYGLVHFNLGNVFEEKNDLEPARQHYEQAVRMDPGYPDAHYNLALAYEKLGLHGKARLQWRSYLKLDPQSHWSLYARQQLENNPFRIVRREISVDEDSQRNDLQRTPSH